MTWDSPVYTDEIIKRHTLVQSYCRCATSVVLTLIDSPPQA